MIWTIKINSALGKGKVFGGGCIKLQSFGMVYYTAVNNKTIEKSAAAAAIRIWWSAQTNKSPNR